LRLDVHLKANKLIGFSIQEEAGLHLADLFDDVPRRLQECVLKHRLREDVRVEGSKRSLEQRAALANDINVKQAELERKRAAIPS
jgi:hypothetical protein